MAISRHIGPPYRRLRGPGAVLGDPRRDAEGRGFEPPAARFTGGLPGGIFLGMVFGVLHSTVNK